MEQDGKELTESEMLGLNKLDKKDRTQRMSPIYVPCRPTPFEAYGPSWSKASWLVQMGDAFLGLFRFCLAFLGHYGIGECSFGAPFLVSGPPLIHDGGGH